MLSPAELAVIDRSRSPQFAGELSGPTHTFSARNLSCGDEVTLQLRIENDLVVQANHTCRACSVCTASADLLCETLTGTSWPAKVSLAEHLAGLGIALSPTRQKCAELPLQALNQT